MEKHIHGGDVYHHQGCIDFSANCNPLGTPEGIKKAIIKSLEHINDYRSEEHTSELQSPS